ncbi:MAG: hypothetical protein FWE38_05095 [Firmicutes bacterium]|nr:hypothetical protein [Bacillota bacterium]
MATTERKIFLGANTPDGFVGFFDGIVDAYPIRRMYILKGGSGVGKSTFIRNFVDGIRERNAGRDLTIDYLMCSSDPKSYDGAIIHELGLAIIDGTRPHIVDPKYPGLIEEIIDLAQFINPKKIMASRDELQSMMAERKQCFHRAYVELKRARELHRVVESHMTAAVDFARVDKLLAKLIRKSDSLEPGGGY